MRNLKKILALVLALVMSLSLMATAGAADFSDKDQISDKYSDAVTVLNGLEVFKGYDNGARFEPQGDITRAEVAAIIYRIATGDVTDTQKDIYSTWGLFTDVADGSWYAGYVNYCANAGYIKGRGNKIFDPNGKVTGYEALAMILRAIGYDKNNEFSGSNWQVNTASIAKQRGITNNITDTLLGQAATREVVAEILFQAILVPTVTFNTATISYTNNATSLGKDVLNLDKVTGVVVANEYANVQDDDLKVLAEGKTQLRVAAGDVRTLDLGTDLNDVGMSENAYIQGSKVLLISEADNTVYDNTADNGKNVDIGSNSKFSDVSGMSKNDGTEFFVDFDHSTKNEANRRIELNVTFRDADAEAEFQKYADGIDVSKVAYDRGYTVYEGTTTSTNKVIKLASGVEDYTTTATLASDSNGKYVYPVTYEKVFRVDDELVANDLSVLKGIFGMADDGDMTRWGVSGSVYVGTNSQDLVGNWNYTGDKSNEMSFSAFKAEYIDQELENNWATAQDGEWVKIIDNDGDGNADYAFKTTFTLDKAVNTYTSGDKSTLRYYSLDLINNKDNVEQVKYMNTVAEGDIVLYTVIDKQAMVWKANSAEDTITKINDIYKRSITATASNGDVYSQSEIGNATRLDQRIEQMSENVNYRMYLDAFGRIRAYEPVDGNRYALLTEMYWGNYQNNRYVINDRLTAEMKAGDEGITERVVNNPLSNDFLLSVTELTNVPSTSSYRNNWYTLNTVMDSLKTNGVAPDYVSNLYSLIGLRNNWNDIVTTTQNWAQNVVLQPATAHLGFAGRSFAAKDIFRNATTNIARYVVNTDGTVTLSTAAQQKYSANGTIENGFAVDYVRLTSTSVRKGQNVFPAVVATGYNSNVNAVNDTEFYIVSNNGVEHFVGFSSLPAISNIRAMYAVARNNSTDKDRLNYWVADVIVIEADNYSAQPDDYLFVLGRADYVGTLSNSRQAVGTQNVLAISAKQGGAIRITPTSYNWGSNTVAPGIYKAYGVAEVESGLYSVATLRPVDTRQVNNALDPESVNTAGFNLRAGVVTKLWELDNRIGVTMTSPSGDVERQINLQGQALSVTQNSSGFISVGSRMNGDYWSNLVNNKHQIIWVEDNNSNALFTIDVTYSVDNSAKGSSMAALLTSIYNNVSESQKDVIASGDHRVRITYVEKIVSPATTSHGTAFVEDRLVNNETEVRINKAPAGFQLANNSTNDVLIYAYGTTTALNLGDGYYRITADASTAFAIRGVTKDLDVVVPVTADNYSITTKTGANITIAKMEKACPNAKDNNGNIYRWTEITGNAQAHAGDVVQVTLNAAANTLDGGYYTLKAVSGGEELTVSVANASSRVFQFTMPAGAVELNPSYDAESYTVDFRNTAGVTYKVDSNMKNIAGQTFTFTASAKPGYELESIVATRGTATQTFTAPDRGSNDVYTVRADVTGSGLTVTFNTKLVNGDVTISAASNIAPSISTPNGSVTYINDVKISNVDCEHSFNITVGAGINNFTRVANGCAVEVVESSATQTTLRVTVYAKGATLVIGERAVNN